MDLVTRTAKEVNWFPDIPITFASVKMNDEKFKIECKLETSENYNIINVLKICDDPTTFGGDDKCITNRITVPKPGLYNFIVSSNIKSNSHSFVLDRLKNDKLSSFLMILGNIHSSPVDSNKEEDYLKQYNKYLFENENVAALLQAKPLVYSFNDLDFDGKNSGANSKGVKHINRVYRELFPNFIKDNNETGIYQVFDIAKTRFIMTDIQELFECE